MENIAKIAAVGIIAAILTVVIRRTNPETAVQLSIAAGVMIVLMAASELAEAVGFIEELRGELGEAYDALGDVVKIIGVAYIAEFSTSALRDAGEGAIASKVELAGKLIIAVMTLPLIRQFTQMILELAGV